MAETSYYTRLRRRNNLRRFWFKQENRRVFLRLFIVATLVILLAVAFFFLRPAISKMLNRTNPGKEVVFRQDESSKSTVMVSSENIPEFSGEDYIVLGDNRPNFTEYDLTHISGEFYSDLDSLGRCGVAYALLDRSMMPQGERGSIGMIKPSGWQTIKYPDLIEDNYLYNRCHLIAYALSGQNDNVKNLITGTRYMNATSMLAFELQVMQYLDYSDNHVLYRVTPYFKDKELVARGVEMEAYSVEDQGESLCFHVFVYNYQPGIEIDYLTGNSKMIDKR